jgi:hypothetical protein
MNPLPDRLETAISQAAIASNAAIAAGITRLQIEFAIPELKPLPIAEQFLRELANDGPVKVFFSDAGAAALARREWGDVPYLLKGLEELLKPVSDQDRLCVVVAPTAVEVRTVEAIADQLGDRPMILLNPELQDVSIVGIGYAGRQLRERFLNTIETIYALTPLEQGILFRSYPGPWQLWDEQAPADTAEPANNDARDDEYVLRTAWETRPNGEQIAASLSRGNAQPNRAGGVLKALQQLLKALSN